MCWKILRKQLKEKHFESFIQERKERQYKRCITEQNFKIKLQFHCGTGIVSGYFAIDATVWGTMFIWDWITRTKINCSWKVCELNRSYNSRNQVNFWATPKNLRAWHFQWAIESAVWKLSDQRLRYIGNTQKPRRFPIETQGRISKSPCTARLASWPYLHQNPPNLLLLSDFLSVLLNQM